MTSCRRAAVRTGPRTLATTRAATTARSLALALGCALGCALAWASGLVHGMDVVRLTPAAVPLMTDVPRLGLNLGGTSTWGAEQLSANVLKNPGFEAPIDRSLVVVKTIAGTTVTDDTPWVARADGLWDGADFEVLSGAAAAARGKVRQYRRAGGNGAGQFHLNPMPAGLRPGDALSVTTTAAGAAVPMWWSSYGEQRTVPGEVRPGSGGRQAVQLIAAKDRPSRLAHHLDALQRAGKLLPVSGPWQLDFWARTDSPGTRLAVTFRRDGSPAFIARELSLDRTWQRYTLPFTAIDDGPYGPLELSFEIRAGDAIVDDVYLGEAKPGPGGFRAATVAMLRQLRPGYLREWQGQLGDTAENRVADASARRPTRHRAGDAELVYHYSLPEFFELCAAVDAKPWIVAPPLMGDDEWRRFGEAIALGARRHRFGEILVEFGNENWNELFRPAGIMAADTHAAVADRGFANLRAGAGDYRYRGIVPVVNAQFVNPAAWRRLATLSQEARRIAVAPYFLYRLDQAGADDAVAAAFDDVVAPLREGIRATAPLGKHVAVYEVNFHTTEGTASSALRDLAVAGAHAGSALARQLLGDLLAGVREQAVYTLAGFDAYTADRSLVRLWGVARDLAPGRLRPTGLALAMMNAAIGGDAHAAVCQDDAAACANVTAAYFRQPRRLALIVASRDPRTLRVRTGIPCSTPVAVRLLDGSDPTRNNEASELVRIEAAAARCESEWAFDLPPRSLAVVHGGDRARGAQP